MSLVKTQRTRVPSAYEATEDAALSACPACGGRDLRHVFTVGGTRYGECPWCGLAHIHPIPLERELRAVFNHGYFSGGLRGGYDDYVADEALHRGNGRLRLQMFADNGIRPPGRLLDVGCAHGFFLDEARADGWNVRGADVSRAAAEYAWTHLGLHVVDDIAAALADAPYDVVTLYQVLEHVVSPGDVLREARSALSPDGALVIETWDRGSLIARLMRSHWQVVAPPSVVWLWDRQSLRLLLQASGFEMTNVSRTMKRVSVRFALSLLDPDSRASRLMHRALDRTPMRDRSFLYRLGDLITVTATPTS